MTNANNGIAWILMHDILSVERAVQWFDQGEVCMFYWIQFSCKYFNIAATGCDVSVSLVKCETCF